MHARSMEMSSRCTFAFLAVDMASARNFLFLRGTPPILGFCVFFTFSGDEAIPFPFRSDLVAFSLDGRAFATGMTGTHLLLLLLHPLLQPQ